MNVANQNIQRCFATQGDFGAIHAVHNRITSGGGVGGFHQTPGNHPHLHETQAHLVRQFKPVENSAFANAQLSQRFIRETHLSVHSKYIVKACAKLRFYSGLAMLLFATQLHAQVLDNGFLTGRYGFRQLLLSTNTSGQPIEARSMVGIISFDGRGSFSFQGTRNVGNNLSATFTGGGSYSVSPAGITTMSSPLDLNSLLNLRLANQLLLGSTTDSAGNTFDLFVAVPLPSSPSSNATLSGNYVGVSLEIPNGIFFNVKNAFFRMTANGQGSFGLANTTGQTSQQGRRVLTQSLGPVTYSLSNDGTGGISFPLSAPQTTATQLVLGDKQSFISNNGDYIVGGSTSQGAHDFFFAMRSNTTTSSPQSFSGLYFGAGMRIDNSRPFSFVGAVNGLGTGKAVWTRRTRQTEGNTDTTAINDYTLAADGVGSMLNNRFALGVNNNIFISAGVSFVDSDNYEIIIGGRSRNLLGTGVFVNPAGVLNGASFAPVGNPISPGQFVTLFGSGLGPASPLVAPSTPFPTTLGGISVTIQGRQAPLYFVSANQISALVPFATSGTSAEVVVRQGSVESNRVLVPVSRTSPGIYSTTQNGIGGGAILKSDFSLVSATNAARRGDTVLIYLTGLGALNPALADGAAAPTTSLLRVTDTVNVYIGGVRATVSFAGAAPGFAGLYQLNVVVPATAPLGSAVPLAIETSSAFHDMVDIAIQP